MSGFGYTSDSEIEMLSRHNKHLREDKEKLIEHLEVTSQWATNFIDELENAGLDFNVFDSRGYRVMEKVEQLENWVKMNRELIEKLERNK